MTTADHNLLNSLWTIETCNVLPKDRASCVELANQDIALLWEVLDVYNVPKSIYH